MGQCDSYLNAIAGDKPFNLFAVDLTKPRETTYEIELARFQPTIEKTLLPAKKTLPDPSCPDVHIVTGRIWYLCPAAFAGAAAITADAAASVLE